MKTPGVKGASFSTHFENLWLQSAGGPYDKNELCGYFHKTNKSRLEIVWVPEQPSCERERLARTVFDTALRTLGNAGTDSEQAPVSSAEPIIGHIAVRLFCEPNAFIRELREVAVVREFEAVQELQTIRPQVSEKTIG